MNRLTEVTAAEATRTFEKIYGQPPRWLSAAPGRVNIIGEHTDYNDGFVLPMAIEHQTVLAADRKNDKEVSLTSITTGESATFSLRGKLERGEPTWANYIRGVVAGFKKLDVPVPGFNAVINSAVPLGSGLSSSAALEVSTATLLEAITGHELDPVDKALLCQKAEHDFAGVPCGIMDQFTSALAQQDNLLLLDCRSRKTELVPVTDSSVIVLIINTNVRHKLADGEYGKRRAQCEKASAVLKVKALRDATLADLQNASKAMDPVDFRRARHVISENTRTLHAAKALRAGDWSKVGTLMYASHDSLRDDYEVSCAELDAVVEIAKGIGEKGGVIGCRMTGGGFGGCAVSFVKADAAARVTRDISAAYEKKTGLHATIFSSRPADGASMLKSSEPVPA